MTVRLDAQQLDQVWDAHVLGHPPPFPVDDPAELRLFELLSEVDRPAPDPVFSRALDRTFASGVPVQLSSISPTRLSAPASRPVPSRARPKIHPPSRRSIPAYALAAVALLLILSMVVIALPTFRDPAERSIPAVSLWVADGPPTSAGVEETRLFSHAWTTEELLQYSLEQWGWLAFRDGVVPPGGRSEEIIGDGQAVTSTTPGISLIHVTSGELAARLDMPALMASSGSSELQSVEDTDVTIGTGETLIFGVGTLAELWNPTESEVHYTAGGAYESPDHPINFFEPGSDDVSTGISIDPGGLTSSGMVDVSMERIVIQPGAVFAYEIDPNSYQLANVSAGGLEQQAWSNGAPAGKSRSLSASSYSLHQDGPGYYTLTNTGTQPVDLSLFEVAPARIDAETLAPAATAETLFSKTLTPEEMTLYESENWKWISFSQGVLQPGDQAIIAEGSPTASDISPEPSGLGAITVTSGTLVANAASGAVIERGATKAIEPVDRRADVSLEAGDTLIAPSNTMPAIWNKGGAPASYMAGGVYIKRNLSPLNELDFDFTRSGITVHPTDFAHGAAITMSLQHVTIPPGASYAYSVSPATWLEAIVSGGQLRLETTIDGTPQGNPRTLLESPYSLHSDGSGDYILTNDGILTIEVSLFRVEAPGTAVANRSPVASTDGER